jgi:hypothetical protein
LLALASIPPPAPKPTPETKPKTKRESEHESKPTPNPVRLLEFTPVSTPKVVPQPKFKDDSKRIIDPKPKLASATVPTLSTIPTISLEATTAQSSNNKQEFLLKSLSRKKVIPGREGDNKSPLFKYHLVPSAKRSILK